VKYNNKDTNLKSIEKALELTIFKLKDNNKFTALIVFEFLWPHFTYGLSWGEKVYDILTSGTFSFEEIMSQFLVRNLIFNKGDIDDPIYYLTDLGNEFASYLTKEGYIFNKRKRKT